MHISNSIAFRNAPPAAIVLTAATANPAELSRAISRLHTLGASFGVPLLRAVMADEIALAMLQPGQPPPLARLDAARRPAILVVGDDDDTTRLGPDGWPGVHRALRWSRAAMLHGTGGRPEHYEKALGGALLARRLVLVETSSALLDPWSEMAVRFLPPCAIARVQPFAGGVHPIMAPREQRQ